MQLHVKRSGKALDGWFCPSCLWEDLSYAQKEDVCMSWLKKVRRPDGLAGSGGLVSDPVWVSEFPAILEYVAMGTLPDGSVRRTATLTLFCELGTWKCYLNDRDSGASLCAAGSSVQDCLSALEAMLESENCPWRFSDRPESGNGRRSRK
jgi:hypothetical protein